MDVLFPEQIGLDVGLLRIPSMQHAHFDVVVACAIWVGEEKLESPPDLYGTGIRLRSGVCLKSLTACPQSVGL